MTSYKQIFDLALRKINDPDLVHWPEEDLANELYGWLHAAISKLPKLRDEVLSRDEFDPKNIESVGFTSDLSDVTKEVLALGIQREWLAPQIASTTLTTQTFSKKEGYSQREFLNGLMALDDSIRLEQHKLLRDASYVGNDYFD